MLAPDTERRDALARLIDPDAWGLFDDPRMKSDEVRNTVVEESREVAQRIIDSGLMATVDWDRREYFSARDRILRATSRTGKCYGVEDGMDGYCKHDVTCRSWPDSAVGPGSDCVR